MGDIINDELILTKDENYNCISNVCTHRAMLLVGENAKNHEYNAHIMVVLSI